MREYRSVAIWMAALLVGVRPPNEAISQDVGVKPKTGSHGLEKNPVDWSLVVKSLQSPNLAPRISREHLEFPSVYTFADQRRIYKSIRMLLLCAEDAWDDMIQNFDNDNYSFTIGFGAGPVNLSVAEVCERVVRSTLHAQYEDIIPAYKFSAVDLPNLHSPSIKERGQLLAWLNARRGVSVQKLQIELADDLVKRIQGQQLKVDERIRDKLLSSLDRLLEDLKAGCAAETSRKFMYNRETWLYLCESDAENSR